MATPTPHAARVDSQTFVGILWGGTALSLCFLIFRIFVRIKCFRRVYTDDFLVLAAWLMLLASAVIWQSQQTPMYAQFALAAGQVIPTPEFLADEATFLHTEVATIFLFYTCLWSVKLSFLIFFHRLGQNVSGLKVWWWCVLGFTIATWATCIGDIQYRCLLGSLEYIFVECTGPGALSFQWSTLHYNCAVDVITDVMIITIPVLMLWNVRISWRRKLALIGIFSLTVIVIIFSIVRVAVVTSTTTQADISWLYMWSNIEMAVSVIVACLASFRQLFVKSEQAGHMRESENLSFWRRGLFSSFRSPNPKSSSGSGSFFWPRGLLSSFRLSKTKSSSGNKSFFSRGTRRHETTPSSHDSKERIVPLDTIYVSRNVGVTSNSIQNGRPMPQAQVYNTCYPIRPGHNDQLSPNQTRQGVKTEQH
ncbi:MAG: hypothetical protein M1830_002143 [Pleopsidium flavum]|nr:MAG: hypothetical protein M1830_002143 [Pleopsidium flavum]